MTRCSTQKKTASGWGARQAALGSHFRKHSTAYTRAAATASGVVLVFGCIPSPSHATMQSALKGAGASNTISVEVAAPTVKRGFVMSESFAGAGVSGARRHSCGQDEPIRKDGCTATDVLLTSCPPYALSKATGGFFTVPVGA